MPRAPPARKRSAQNLTPEILSRDEERRTIAKVEITETGQGSRDPVASLPILPKLRLVYTPGAGIVERGPYALPRGSTPIGRELPDGDGVQVTDKRISRVHARLEVDDVGQEVRIVDEHSKNGTFVNGCRLPSGDSATLADRDVVRVGDSLLVFRYEPLQPEDAEIPELLGTAPEMMALRHRLHRIAAAAGPVLVLGETGTGKELVARALHQKSGRRGDFVAVNCAAIPESLAESQLFGHVAGAFTGAKPHPGFFRAAHGGTLFLDEIGELALPLQAKLLRALQELSVVPVGAVHPLAVDVRLVAATHRELAREVAQGRFRSDLYGRLAGIVLQLPPLRTRREDIPLLLQQTLGDKRQQLESVQLLEALLLYPWPRNVRELLQIGEHLRLLGSDQALYARLAPVPPDPGEPPPAPPAEPPPPSALEPALPPPTLFPGRQAVSRSELEALMTVHQGVIRQVAAVLGCSRRQVGRMLEHYGLERAKFRGQKD